MPAIEDDPNVLYMIDTILQELGYRTVLLKQGEAPFDMLVREQPDLVILDLGLGLHSSEETGWDVLQRVRSDPALHHTPIIICIGAPKLKPQGDTLLHEYGCDLLMKPFKLEDLEASVARSFGHSLEAVSSVRQKQDQP
jgi:CheY-like chemotaxis protein